MRSWVTAPVYQPKDFKMLLLILFRIIVEMTYLTIKTPIKQGLV